MQKKLTKILCVCGKDGKKRDKCLQVFKNRGAVASAGQLPIVHTGMDCF